MLKGCVVLASGLCPSLAGAVVLSLAPSADTTLMEVAPTNNNGAQLWVNSGTTQNGPSDRGLFHFDLSSLPTNALVRSASLTLVVVRQPKDGQANAAFGLYRMLRPWGEGNKYSILTPGQGASAAPGEATWLHSFYPTNAWSIPGGARSVDFAGTESSSQFIYGTIQSPYTFESTPELVSDVQDWVRRPQANFGWMLLCDDEGTIFTARRFGSREDTNNAPVLQIDYVIPPSVDRIQPVGSQVILFFQAEPAQGYTVEWTEVLTPAAWLPLAVIEPQLQPTNLVVVDSNSVPQRFYRLATY